MASECCSIAEIRRERATHYYSEELFEGLLGLLAHSRDGGAVGAADPSNSRGDVTRPHDPAGSCWTLPMHLSAWPGTTNPPGRKTGRPKLVRVFCRIAFRRSRTQVKAFLGRYRSSGQKMNLITDRCLFEVGYKEGWRVVMGDSAPVPDVPAYPLVGGSPPYKQGLIHGMKDAGEKGAVGLAEMPWVRLHPRRCENLD